MAREGGVIVLGIDPGSQHCGFGAVLREGSKMRVIESGVVSTGSGPLAERLARLFDGITAALARSGAGEVAVESVFTARGIHAALVLGQARGVVLAASARAGLPVFEYAPAQVKLAVAGNGRAEKLQMVRMARALLGVDVARADEADALAVAVCHHAHRQSLLRRVIS
jgi:crossover junction endodeoxyribonuclease RuvC